MASLAQMFLGQPESVTARSWVNRFGVDVEVSVLVDFAGGTAATLMCSLRSRSPTHAGIFGTTGWIDVLADFDRQRTPSGKTLPGHSRTSSPHS